MLFVSLAVGPAFRGYYRKESLCFDFVFQGEGCVAPSAALAMNTKAVFRCHYPTQQSYPFDCVPVIPDYRSRSLVPCTLTPRRSTAFATRPPTNRTRPAPLPGAMSPMSSGTTSLGLVGGGPCCESHPCMQATLPRRVMGWNRMYVETAEGVDDDTQAYAAGYLEGYMSNDLIFLFFQGWLRWGNTCWRCGLSI